MTNVLVELWRLSTGCVSVWLVLACLGLYPGLLTPVFSKQLWQQTLGSENLYMRLITSACLVMEARHVVITVYHLQAFRLDMVLMAVVSEL